MASFGTAGNIINDAAVELGLWATPLTDPYTDTSIHAAQLVSLLKGVGRKLRRLRAWSHLQRTHTFSTVASTATYNVPADFGYVLPQTHWDRTAQRELLGPVAPQGWSYFQSGLATALPLNTAFRVRGDVIELYPTPSAVSSLSFDYVSGLWASLVSETVPTMAAPTQGTDIVYFDAFLSIAALKLAFLRAKGFPSDAAYEDFREAYALVVATDSDAPVLSLSGPRAFPFLSWCNAPDGDWGL